MDLKKYGDVLENISLKNYTSFKIGGNSEYLVLPNTVLQLIELKKYLKNEKIPYFILGSGSNIIVPDEDYKGVIIKLDNLSKLEFKGNNVIVGAGYYLPSLVKASIDKGLKGLEWALGIPSSIGGAVIGNAGAYLSETFDFIKTVTVLDNDEVKVLKKSEIDHGYRTTMFKNKKDIIILEIEIELEKGNYETSNALIMDRMKRRLESQPLEYPSAGSVFRNPENLFVGKIIEDLGLKGHLIGGAQISEKHANFIINRGNATSKDIISLINFIKEKVKDAHGIDLVLEIEIMEW